MLAAHWRCRCGRSGGSGAGDHPNSSEPLIAAAIWIRAQLPGVGDSDSVL